MHYMVMLILYSSMAVQIKKAARPVPSDFIESDGVIEKHNEVKNDVVDLLFKLAEEADGFVIEQIEQDITKIKIRGAGRVINILFSGISIVFVANPWTPVVGAIGVTIGYVISGSSVGYVMWCSTKHAGQLKKIQERVEIQLKCYMSSQEKVFKELDKYEVFEHGRNFEENLAVIKALVRETEKQVGKKLSNMKNLFCNLEIFFNNLEDFKKEKLNSKDFLSSVANVLGAAKGVYNDLEGKDAICAATGGVGAIGGVGATAGILGASTEGVSLATEGVAAATEGVAAATEGVAAATEGVSRAWTFGTIMHGLNFFVNGYFLYEDTKEFNELNRMRKAWNEGGEKKMTVRENSKFDTDMKMKKIILQIRDKIIEDGF